MYMKCLGQPLEETKQINDLFCDKFDSHMVAMMISVVQLL